MRLELNDAVNNCSLINDSYNSDLNSLSIALDFLEQQKQHEKKTLILSDILQSGLPEEALYEKVAGLIRKKGVSKLIGIGPALIRQSRQLKHDSYTSAFFESTADFLKRFSISEFHDETILLKGARAFAFETIAKKLEQKAHETVLEIDLNAILHNLSVYQSLLKPETKIMAMVKAFSYGTGSFEIANILQQHKVDYLAVAYADEGAELRKAGIQLPVMVMNPEWKSFDLIVQYRLEPELYSIKLLKQFLQAMQQADGKNEEPYPIHVELETGMNRLGFTENDLDELISIFNQSSRLRIQSIFTHLAASEDSSLDEYSNWQLQRFETMSGKLINACRYPVMRHVLNTAGVVRFPKMHFDMVRLGIGLYGIDSTQQLQSRLQNVSTLKSTISQIKKISSGETIGYGRAGIADKDMTIATVGIGYADGYSRHLSGGRGKMLLHGKVAPVVGNICMDMTMIDISEITEAEEGDEVVVFGKNLPVQQVAAWAQTIPYEVISTISRRVKRIHLHD
jgi:alanine racemase